MTNLIMINDNGLPQQQREAVADETITPGQMLERTATGVKKHTTAGGVGMKFFADIDLAGNPSSTKAIDTDYAAAAIVKYFQALPGQVVNAWLKAGENATLTSFLVSGDDGLLAVGTMDASALEGALVGQPEVAVDNSGGGSAVRIQVRIA